MLPTDIYSYVLAEESAYSRPISLTDGWEWGMKDHLRRCFLYKHSQFEQNNEDRVNRPFSNIIRPILNIHYRTEGFDVKNIELYVNQKKSYYKSLLIKKFHEQWAIDNNIDTFVDELVESYVDYGGALVKNIKGVRPEVVQLLSIAFCDQTNILSGPIGIKHYFSPDELREMANFGWGDEKKGATISIETLISLADNNKKQDKEQRSNDTPGKYVEIYEVHGTFPLTFLGQESEKYASQMHIIAFYKDHTGQKIGVTLFAVKEPKSVFKFLARDGVYGRALGFSAIEELFEDQEWTNKSEADITEMLELASKIFFKTTDPQFKVKNNITNQNSGAIFTLTEGRDISQLDTFPRNISVFNDAVAKKQRHAEIMGAAGESLQGISPSSGTPFKLQELVTNEARGLHIYRQGKIATFVNEIYRDWSLEYFKKEILQDKSFLSELTTEEFRNIFDNVVTNRANKAIVDQILHKTARGEFLTQDAVDAKIQELKLELSSSGNKQFLEWLADDFKDAPIVVRANIAGKQQNLVERVDKLTNIVRQIIANPKGFEQAMQMTGVPEMFNNILESSGLSPVLFGVQTSARTEQAIPASSGQLQESVLSNVLPGNVPQSV